MNTTNFESTSKELHKDYSKCFWRGAFDPSHPDTRRHYELLASSDGLLDYLRPASLVSIGDNLGRDAGYFKKRYPDCKCIATDLHADGIQQAATEGYVDMVLSADVEHLPFEDNSIDCVIAKEAFHHWPRPMLGLYEMLRVAKKAVLLIEPNDVFNSNASTFADSDGYRDEYEKVGNYKYQISLRELLKVSWSLYYPAVAAVGLNDPYHPDLEIDDWFTEKQKLDLLGDQGKRQFNLMSVAIYKPNHEPLAHQLPARSRYYKRPINPFFEA
jgi:SAM-dependent methyltransferase